MIFVVDDDARIRSMTADALRKAGYDVRDFEGGASALAAMQGAVGLHLILSDVLMPEMTGPHFIAQALTIQPDVKVHYMSGDVGDTCPKALEPWPLLAKPFTMAALKKAVAKALAEPKAG